jgi:hypothetical protein
MGSLHLAQQQELPQQQHEQQLNSRDIGGQPEAAAACLDHSGHSVWIQTAGGTTDSELPLPLSSMQWERVEHSDSRYGQVMQATVLLLSLLQLAL